MCLKKHRNISARCASCGCSLENYFDIFQSSWELAEALQRSLTNNSLVYTLQRREELALNSAGSRPHPTGEVLCKATRWHLVRRVVNKDTDALAHLASHISALVNISTILKFGMEMQIFITEFISRSTLLLQVRSLRYLRMDCVCVALLCLSCARLPLCIQWRFPIIPPISQDLEVALWLPSPGESYLRSGSRLADESRGAMELSSEVFRKGRATVPACEMSETRRISAPKLFSSCCWQTSLGIAVNQVSTVTALAGTTLAEECHPQNLEDGRVSNGTPSST